VLVGTATVTAQGAPAVDPSTRSGDFYLATAGDLELATNGDLLMATDTAAGTRPPESDEDLARITGIIRWARTAWEHRDVLLPEPATGLAGHSFGGGLTGRAVVEGAVPVAAHASLSGIYPSDLVSVAMPKLLMWGTSVEEEVLLVPVGDWETRLPARSHVVELSEAGHWDYLPAGRSGCVGEHGCRLLPQLAADLVTTFFGRYLPPERWTDPPVPAWLPWFRVGPSLEPPPLLLTTEQRFFAGGHFKAWKALGQAASCSLTLHWRTNGSWRSRTRS